EPIAVLQTAPILQRRICRGRATHDTIIHANKHRLIVALIILRKVTSWIEVFLTEQKGVASPVRDVGDFDLAALENDARDILGEVARLSPERSGVTFLQRTRTGAIFIFW